MIIGPIVFSVSICFISWLFAIIANNFLVKTPLYPQLSNLNFIQSETLNRLLLVDVVKWIIKNTFFKYFNQNIKIQGDNIDLKVLRNEMTLAEISHLIAFVVLFRSL